MITTKGSPNGTNIKTARIMEDVQIKLSALWVALMFIWQQGDVLRLYSGDFMPGGEDITSELISTEVMWLVSAIWMTIPVVMLFLSLTLKYKANRWSNIIVAIFFVVLNLIGLGSYPWGYDKFLIIVGFVFNILIVWYAWKWPKQEA
jgi:hypothetical protein